MARRGAGTIHPADLHAGQRLKLLRRQRGISQSVLADAIGVSFQQIQKYERGANRISLSTLVDVAAFFQIPAGYFLDGLEQALPPEAPPSALIASADGKAIAQAFARIPAGPVRKSLVEFIRSVAGMSEAADAS